MATVRKDRVRVTIFFKRKEDVTQEAFDNFWLGEFPKLFTSLEVVKGKILKYEQGRANQGAHKNIAKNGFNIAPYDAQATIEGANFYDLVDVFTSDEYRSVVDVEAVKYFEKGAGQVLATNFITVVDDNN